MEKMTVSDPFSLDPFSTVCRLALLPYMDEGVKIGICDNSIQFFDASLMAWVRRNIMDWRKKGCSKHDLYHLRIPIERAIVWYKEMAPDVLNMASQGLERLATNYVGHGNVKETINSMVQLLKGQARVTPEDMTDKPSLRRLSGTWTKQEIEAVAQLFSLLKEEKSNYIVDCINEFIRGKEPELLAIIREPNI
jgi:hypothetical protein